MPTPNAAPTPDFNVHPWRTMANVTMGNTAVFPVNVSSVNSFQGNVSIQPSALNPLLASADPAVLVLRSNSVNMTTIRIPTIGYLGGNYTVQMTFSSGALDHTLSLRIRLLPPPGQDFSLTALQSTETITQQDNGNWFLATFTLQLASIGGFTGLVDLYSPYFWTYGNTTIAPGSVIVRPNSTADAVLTVSRAMGGSSLSMSFTVTANTTGLFHSADVRVIYAVPNFLVTVSPTGVALGPGQNSSVRVTLWSIAFSGPITLDTNVGPTIPYGPIASLDSTLLPLPWNGTISTTLRINTSPNTPRQDYTVYIGASAGLKTNVTSLSIIVPPTHYGPGVQVGTSASYSLTTNSPIPPLSMALTVTGIVGFNVSYDVDLYSQGFLVNSTQCWTDVASGDFSLPALVPFPLVAANLTYGDPAYLAGIFQGIHIGRTEAFSTVGGFRNTVVAELQSPGTSLSETLRWDRQTGIMVGIDATIPVNSTYTLSLRYTLVHVSVWTSLGTSFTASMTGNGSKRGFAADVTGGEPPYTYAWSFGDGASSSLQNANHTYAGPGNYTVVLMVTDSAGNAARSTQLVTVAHSQPPPSVSLATGTGLIEWFRTHWVATVIILGLWIAWSLSTTIVLFHRRQKQRRSFTASIL